MRTRLSLALIAAAPSIVTFAVNVEAAPYSISDHVSQKQPKSAPGTATIARVRARRRCQGQMLVAYIAARITAYGPVEKCTRVPAARQTNATASRIGSSFR